MPLDTLLSLLMVVALAVLALTSALPASVRERVRMSQRGRRADETRDVELDTSGHALAVEHDAVRYQESGDPSDLRPGALDRIIRVGTWVFLFTVTTLVAVTDLWGDRQGPILVLLAVAGIYAFVLHELVPRQVPDTALLVVEGGLSVAFAATLIALTGGALSPFFFALPLIVVGAATIVTPGVTLALTFVAAVAYVVAIVIAGTESDPAWLVTAAVNLTALGLVAYVGMAVGREQRRAREDANRVATVDPLTGLRTRPFLFAALERELDRSQRTGRAFCLLMIDLDDLKVINDRHGHLVGDRALRLVGDVIGDGIRRIDTGARFGGDEFVVLLPETDPTGGWVLAEKIRQGVAAASIEARGTRVSTSVSVGIVTHPQDGETVGTLLERADEAMYRSKRGGRDRTTGVPVMDGPAARPRHGAGSGGRRGDPV